MSGVTSISSLILFIGVLIAFGAVFPSAVTTISTLVQSQKMVGEKVVTIKNTDFELQNATYDASSDTASVELVNTGSRSIKMEAVNVLLDGEYTTFTSNKTVVAPSETVKLSMTTTSQPSVVKVVEKYGISRRLAF